MQSGDIKFFSKSGCRVQILAPDNSTEKYATGDQFDERKWQVEILSGENYGDVMVCREQELVDETVDYYWTEQGS